MTGIVLDLFTVILMVVLAFVCGYSAGHKFGRSEVLHALQEAVKTITKTTKPQQSIDISQNNTEKYKKILEQYSDRKFSFMEALKESTKPENEQDPFYRDLFKANRDQKGDNKDE